MKRIVLAVAAAATMSVMGGVESKQISARDIFGIAVDEPPADCIRSGSTNGMATVSDGKGHYCFGREFLGVEPKRFELGAPDDKGRRMVRMVKGERQRLGRKELEKRCAEISACIKGWTNLKREGGLNMGGKDATSAAWAGVGFDGIPFALGLSACRSVMDTNLWNLTVCVMDYARFSEEVKRTDLPALREKDREERLLRLEKKTTGRQLRMMQEKSYSGKWGCKAKGYDSISFCFDRSGLGCFGMNLNGFMYSQSAAGGWFYWTADDKGEITVHADQPEGGTRAFKLRYDYERNVMVPDMNDYPFADKVIPNDDNPSCEMRFISDTTAVEVARSSEDRRERPVGDMSRLLRLLGKQSVASFDELCAVVEERVKREDGIMVYGNGLPSLSVGAGEDGGIMLAVCCEVERKGDPAAPKFDCIAGRMGPDVAGKKEHEVFFDPAELSRLARSLGGFASEDEIVDEGIWSRERQVTLMVMFKTGAWPKCKEFLGHVVEKGYKFPIEVLVRK